MRMKEGKRYVKARKYIKLNQKAVFYHSKTAIILFSILLSFQSDVRGGDVRRCDHVVYFNYNDHANGNTKNNV